MSVVLCILALHNMGLTAILLYPTTVWSIWWRLNSSKTQLSPVHVQRHDDATDGWALATSGYAA